MDHSTLTAAKPSAIDKEKGIIYGAKIIQLGPLNDDRPFVIDGTTLEQVTELGNASQRGVKARFTHPTMCDDGLGRHLGSWKNFRNEGDAVYADLHFCKASYNTPNGDLATYVMELAEEKPQDFGVSIAPTITSEMNQQYEGHVPEQDEPILFRLEKLNACDVVGDPAATRGGLLSNDLTDLPTQINWYLNKHFAKVEPRVVASKCLGFLNSYYGENFIMADTIVDTDPKVKIDAPLDLQSLSQPFIEAFGDSGAKAFLEGKSLLCCYQEASVVQEKHVVSLQLQVDELQAKLSAALQAGGEPGTMSTAGEPVQMTDGEKLHADRIAALKKQGASDPIAHFAAAISK